MSLWLALTILNLPVLVLMWFAFFDGWEDFFKSIGYLFRPDIFSWFSGEIWEDKWAEMKLLIWVALWGIIIVCEIQWLEGHHPWPGWISGLLGVFGVAEVVPA